VKPYTKIACILAASTALVGVWLASVHSEGNSDAGDPITLAGMITPDTFLALKDRLIHSSATNKTLVVTESGGGSWESALALGILIHQHGWNVEVVDLCASSCANFIFPAGKEKYLHDKALLLFHGGPHQENLLAKSIEVERAAMSGAPLEARDPGQERTEGHALIDEKGPQRLQVLEFLAIRNLATADEYVSKLTTASDRFYEELGVNVLLPTYGQTGGYEPTYKSHKYGGFMYRLDSLRRLGIRDIHLEDGEWHPERNPVYQDVYEVTYP
jgi:hypothetical protein